MSECERCGAVGRVRRVSNGLAWDFLCPDCYLVVLEGVEKRTLVGTISFDWDAPPLRENDRLHWSKRAAVTRNIRWVTRSLSGMQVPKGIARGEVRLVWEVADKRRRDAAAANPTLKAVVDGLVDAGVFNDDHYRIIKRAYCEIERGEVPGVRVEIYELEKS